MKRVAAIVQILWLLSFIFALPVYADDPTSRYVTLSPIPTTALPPSGSGIPVQFELWDSAIGGTQISVEAHTVDTDANANITNDTGFNDLLFGRPVGLSPRNFPSGSSRYLDVTQGGSTVLAARMPLYASPFTISSGPQMPSGLRYHASFQGAVQTLVGGNSRVTPFDGFVILQTDSNAPNALVDLTSNNPQAFTPIPGLDRSGAFLSLRLKALLGPANPGQPGYFVAGQAPGGGTSGNGFGFKTLGGADCGGGVSGGALNGVTILNGSETLADLAATVCSSGPPVDLLAVRRAASVDFYVNGVLKGTSTSNLPSMSFSIYDLRLTNSPTLMGSQTWWVSFLTIGIPSF